MVIPKNVTMVCTVQMVRSASSVKYVRMGAPASHVTVWEQVSLLSKHGIRVLRSANSRFVVMESLQTNFLKNAITGRSAMMAQTVYSRSLPFARESGAVPAYPDRTMDAVLRVETKSVAMGLHNRAKSVMMETLHPVMDAARTAPQNPAVTDLRMPMERMVFRVMGMMNSVMMEILLRRMIVLRATRQPVETPSSGRITRSAMAHCSSLDIPAVPCARSSRLGEISVPLLPVVMDVWTYSPKNVMMGILLMRMAARVRASTNTAVMEQRREG
ncbi:hypothetical protein A2765_01250 [Candidatus Kaiserbacteria bacterium RIFCSPHIGHO2_01_FULL_56_24]|uniref:Uncharacterized protein n=1 Tax=Candidatus Kaiserbacteria bacterium RIFCSPHIGHO2_01_FULL_56_24 TaxID=1798487 RepID=A0A1F6DG99_9BACT|nr:MAG: hypothetical protein A2765_01250 [Candidatus Kaiserbacteria bacterium RIFCSPHIGHO2_01_FULL_56_24]